MGKKQELKAEIQKLKRINAELMESAQLEEIEGHFKMFISKTDVETMVTLHQLFFRNINNPALHSDILEKSRRFIQEMDRLMLSKQNKMKDWKVDLKKEPLTYYHWDGNETIKQVESESEMNSVEDAKIENLEKEIREIMEQLVCLPSFEFHLNSIFLPIVDEFLEFGFGIIVRVDGSRMKVYK